MNKLSERYTVAALMGLPVFCIGREYKEIQRDSMFTAVFGFEFANGYGASVIQFVDKSFSGGCDWELGVLTADSDGTSLCYDTPITPDVERGDAEYIDELLTQIEAL